jgi:hypothetical protein
VKEETPKQGERNGWTGILASKLLCRDCLIPYSTVYLFIAFPIGLTESVNAEYSWGINLMEVWEQFRDLYPKLLANRQALNDLITCLSRSVLRMCRTPNLGCIQLGLNVWAVKTEIINHRPRAPELNPATREGHDYVREQGNRHGQWTHGLTRIQFMLFQLTC